MPSPEQVIEAVFASIIIVAGIVTYTIAPKRGRGTIGFRVGPAYASEEVWARINKEAGAVLTAMGAAMLVAAVLNPPIHLFTAASAAAIVAEIAALTIRAGHLAEKASLKEAGESEGAERPEPLKTWVGWGRVIAAAAPPAITVVTALTHATGLPEEVPIHFGPSGAPDSYVDTQTFLYVITPLFIALSAAGLAYALATRHPLIGYRPWGRPGEAAKVVSDVVTLVSLAVAVGYIDIVHYAASGAHIIPPWAVVAFPIAAVARAIAWAWSKGMIRS